MSRWSGGTWTKQRMESMGWVYSDARCYLPQSKTRRDLFGIIDWVALEVDDPTVDLWWTYGIQDTSWENARKRLLKIQESEYLRYLLGAGWIIQVWGWKPENTVRWKELKIITVTGPRTATTEVITPDGLANQD